MLVEVHQKSYLSLHIYLTPTTALYLRETYPGCIFISNMNLEEKNGELRWRIQNIGHSHMIPSWKGWIKQAQKDPEAFLAYIVL